MHAVIHIFKNSSAAEAEKLQEELQSFVKIIRGSRKNQIKRIKNHEIGTRNSILFLNHLGEFRNLAIFSNRMVNVLNELILDPEEEFEAAE